MKNSKKTLLMSLISLLVSVSMFIGSTFAWFTDEVVSSNNKIVSGTLKVDLELLDKATGEWNSIKESHEALFNYDKWEPGYVDTTVLKVENEGNLSLKWEAKFYSETELSILADAIDVYVCPSETELKYPTTRDLEGYTLVGDLRTFINSIEETTNGILEPSQTAYLGIALKMRESAGNEYQNLSLGGAFDIRVYATQNTLEKDSFDDLYDILADQSILATQTKTLAEGASSIMFELISRDVKIATVNVPASAILDPSQPVTVTFDGINPASTVTVDENTKAYAYDITVTNLKEELTSDDLITVVVTAPNALAAMKTYHNGVLVENAVYDEVAGTITFKTDSFSPFAFTTKEYEVSTLAQLREKMQEEGALVKLTQDITMNLSGEDRDDAHKTVSSNGKNVYYNGINIKNQNVAIDLNGHKITVDTNDYNSTGALFFVDANGSLNIIDSVGSGFIKMLKPVYAVWAPYADPSYVDIFSGTFIADSYAGDEKSTPGHPNYWENDNRALIYAGTGGNMNIYGGYYLYNNTPNDTLNRNNGAFNAKDFVEDKQLITIHEGVMLINKEYRQNPANTSTPNGSFDNYSIKLAKDCEVVKTQSKSVTIDGTTYSDWYQVIRGITSITAKATKNSYNIGHEFTAKDFSVYAIGNNGSAGHIENFKIGSVDTSSVGEKTVTISYTNDSGKTISTTCKVKVENLRLIEINYNEYDGSYHRMWWFGPGNYDVSGWKPYPDILDQIPTNVKGNNGEKVSGFENQWALIQRQDPNAPQDLEFYSNNNWYGLTIDDALPYTTIGINCVVGYDAEVLGFGYYIGDDLSTLKYNAPAANHKGEPGYEAYGPVGGQHALTQFTLYDFKPGETYEVHWVVVFEDGIQPLSDWTVNMKDAEESDKVFVDTEKPNANVIIMAGQSNMYGASPLTQDIKDYYSEHDFSNVYIKYSNIQFENTETGTMKTLFSNNEFEKYKLGIGGEGNYHFGPETTLSALLSTTDGLKDQQWFIIKYAAAGTVLNGQWTNNCVVDGQTTNLTDGMLNYVQDAIDELSDEYDVQVRSFMWMQGESDAINLDWANKYAQAEENLVNRVRTTFAGYATRPISSVAGSGISFINAGIADNDTNKTAAEGGPNDWIFDEVVNAAKISNSQFLCSVPGLNAGNLTTGPLKGYSFIYNGANIPTIVNPDQSGAIVNSIYIDTHHLLSKAKSNPSYDRFGNPHYEHEQYTIPSDITDWAHYGAWSMEELGSLFGSCLHYLIQQNG